MKLPPVAYGRQRRPRAWRTAAIALLGAALAWKAAFHLGLAARGEAFWHGECLRAGDVHFDLDEPYYGGPHHVQALVGIGRPAGPVLLALLRDDAPTPLTYRGETLWFPIGGDGVGDGARPVRRATVSDLAAYCLVRIYGRDLGFRSYLRAAEKSRCISSWEKIVQSQTVWSK